MISHGLPKSGILVAFVLAAGVVAEAQSVVAIREGTFTINDDFTNSFSLEGTQGFSATGSVSLARSPYPAISECNLAPECAPGEVIDLSGSWVGSDISSIVQFRGKTYTEVGGTSDDAQLFIAFTASVELPAMTGHPVTVAVPFDFAGAFTFGLNGPRPQQVPITGGGTATVTLVPLAEDPNFWHIQQVVFEFAPLNGR